jgi:hypothetical protein
MPDRDVEVGLKITPDKASTQSTIKDVDRLDASLRDVQQTTDKLQRSYSGAEAAARKTVAAQSTAFNAEYRALKAQTGVFANASNQLSILGGFAAGVGATDLGQSMMLADNLLDTARAAQLASATLPEMSKRLIEASPAASKLTEGMAKLIPGLTQSAANMLLLGGAVGLVGGAAIGLIALLDAQNEAQEKRAKELQAQLDTEERRAAFEKNATQQKIDDAIKTAELQMQLEDEKEARYQKAVDAAKTALDTYMDEVDRRVVDPSARNQPLPKPFPLTVEGIEIKGEGDIKVLEQNLNDAKDASGEFADELAWLNTVTVSATATSDALAEKTNKILALQREETNFKAEQANRERTWTTEQVNSRMAQIEIEKQTKQDEIDRLKLLQGAGIDTGAAVKALQIEVRKLGDEEYSLTNVVRDAARARAEAAKVDERLADVSESATSAVINLRKAEQDLSDATAEAAQKEADLAAQYQDDVTRMEADYQRKREQAVDDFEYNRAQREEDFQRQREDAAAAHEQRLQDLRDQAAEQLADAEETYHKEEAKRRDDYQLGRRRAEEDHNQNLQDAAARLDAVAVIKELQGYKKEQDRAKEDYDRQTKEQQRAHDKQLRDLRSALDKQLREEEQAYRKQQQQADNNYRLQEQRQKAAFDRQLAQQQQEYARQQAERATQYQRDLTSLQTANTTELTSKQAHYDALQAQLTTFQGQEYALRQEHYENLRKQLQSAFGSGNTGTPGTTLPTRYQVGGYTYGNRIRTEPGEYVLTPQTTRTLEKGLGALTQQKIQNIFQGNSTTSIDMGGMNFGDIGKYTPHQLKGIIRREMVSYLREAGDGG